MDETEVRFLLGILHDIFPQKTARVVTQITQEDAVFPFRQLEQAMPTIRNMLNDMVGKEIPFD